MPFSTGSAAGPFAYVLHWATPTSSVVVVDLATNTEVASIPVGSLPSAIAADSAGSRVYVVNLPDDTVSVIDTSTNAVVATVSAPGGPIAIAVSSSGNRAYVIASSTVYTIDTTTNVVIAAITVGNSPKAIAMSPDGTRAYVANRTGGTITVIDTATNTVIAAPGAGNFPNNVAVSPDGTRIHVTSQNSNIVTVLDATTLGVATTNAGALFPVLIAARPDGSMVADAGAGSVVRMTTAGATTSLPLAGASVTGLAFHPSGSPMYVLMANGLVHVVDPDTMVEISTFVLSLTNMQGLAIASQRPVITGSIYDAATGMLTVNGTSFPALAGAANDIVASKLSLRGEGPLNYTLTDTPNVERTSSTQFTLVLSAADKAFVNMIMNKNGTSSTGGTSYGLVAAEDWAAGAPSSNVIADLTLNPVTVSNVAIPAITSASYNPVTRVLTATGTGFLTRGGGDIIAARFTMKGLGGLTYTLTDTPNVGISLGTRFTLTLSATDGAAVAALMDKIGTAASDGTTYVLSALEDWAAGADASLVIAKPAIPFTLLDGVPPTILSIARANPNPTNAASVDFTVTFSEPVTGVTTRGFNTVTSSVNSTVAGVAGSGTTYTVTVNQLSGTGFLRLDFSDLDEITDGTNPLGGIGFFNGDFTGEAYDVDRTPPSVSSVAVPANATYAAGGVLTFMVTLNEATVVTGAPFIPIVIGATTRNASYISGSGSTALTFRYTVVPGDVDTNGITVGAAINANGGTLRDAIGNDAVLALNAVGSTAAVLVDATIFFTVTPSAGANGSITPATPQAIAQGGTRTFTVAPSAGYTAAVGGTCGGALVGNTFTTAAITANCTVSATFTQITFVVTPSAGANGTIAPSTPQTIAQAATTTFTVTPSAGYTAAVGGTCGGALAGNTFTTSAITANCTVAATFTAIPKTTFTGPSATGSGAITASFTGGGPACTFATNRFIALKGDPASPPAGTAPANIDFPHGLFDFTLASCTAGSTVTMTIAYPTPLRPGTDYWKYGPTQANAAPHWYVLPSTLSGSTVTFAITDGGLGDDDLAANGSIVDQGGPGIGSGFVPVQVPTLSEWMMVLMGSVLLLVGMRAMRKA